MTKISQNRDNEELHLTFWQVHQIYALKFFFPNGFDDLLTDDKISINEFQMLKRWNKREKSKWTTEEIYRYGFVIVDSFNTENETPEFINRSFAEFFLTKFAIQEIYELDEDSGDYLSENEIELRLKLLLCMANDDTYEWNFIESFIAGHKTKNLNTKISEFIKTEKVTKILLKNEKINLKISKVFSIDR